MSGFNLSALAVRERSVTLFLLVAISIAGVVAFLTLGRAEDPSFTIKQMTVVTAWPGATAKEMEELVAERLEKRMQDLRWYDRTETFTRPGLAFTTVNARPCRVNVSVLSYQRRSCIRFSSLSATSSSISFAVAPGQAVTTVICLIVKEGSSARPNVRNATTPAMEIATSRNKVTERSRTARAERLKPLIARSRR